MNQQQAQSFCCGYVSVKVGKITHELTLSEIETLYPRIKCPKAFEQGMLDALKRDSYRYRSLKYEAGIETWG